MTRIYIVGSVGSGKTTLAKKLSSELNVPHIELDNVTWEYNPNGRDRKRSVVERTEMFSTIVNRENWIMENVGREEYNGGFDRADAIIYLKINRLVLYKQIFMRWIKQRQGIEESAYPPDFKMLRQMFAWANKELNNSKLNNLGPYKDKLLVLNHKQARNYKYDGKRY